MHNDDEDSTQLGLYGKNDHVYMQSLSAAVVQRSPRYLMVVVILMALFVIAALVWMSWAKIDVVIRGSGKVVPASQVQIIQSLEGGIVSEILVSEGEMVDVEQPLVKINDIAFSSSFEENRLLYLELLAKASRLQAEGFDQAIEVNAEVQANAPQIMASEQSLFESNQQQLEEVASILDEQISQSESSLKEAQAKKTPTAKIPWSGEKGNRD